MGGVFIGVDVGTASARAGVFDAAGRLIASARRPIAVFREAGEIVEHSSADIWSATCAAVREATTGLSTLGEVVGHRLRRHLLAGRARRDGRLADRLADRAQRARHDRLDGSSRRQGGRRDQRRRATIRLRFVGGVISPEMQPPKLMWLARHVPETFATRAVLRPHRFPHFQGERERRIARPARSSANGCIRAASGAGRRRLIGRSDLGACWTMARGASAEDRRARERRSGAA